MNVSRDHYFSEYISYVDILRARAQARPSETVFTFLPEAAGEPRELGTADWDFQARTIGARLQALGLAGERAILAYPAGLEFLAGFFGCLYAGVTAVPAPLPRPRRPATRLRAIATDAAPAALLVAASSRVDAARWMDEIPELSGAVCLATDEIDPRGALEWRPPEVGSETLAVLQYTSGSTATPRGVAITHRNLLHNSELIRRCFGSTPESRGVFWLPLYHDMGLIGGLLQTLYCGGRSTLLAPAAFLQRPLRWLETISQTGATISGGPNFAYDLCTRKVSPEQARALDLSRWSVAFCGAEPIRPETLERFALAFGSSGFRRAAFLPCYGLAEATLIVSGSSPAEPVTLAVQAHEIEHGAVVEASSPQAAEVRTLVGCGKVAADLDVAIVDPETCTPRPDDQIGEIWVAGPSVAAGYWNQPALTEATFGARVSGSGDGPYLRTGDLGFARGGELFVTGRLKDVIVLGGRNIYPQDVEWALQGCHPALRAEGGAVFGVEVDGAERLVVVHEIDRRAREDSPEAIFAAIRRVVAHDFDAELHAISLIPALGLPKTSSGKVQRHACRAAFECGSLDVVAQWTADTMTGKSEQAAACAARQPATGEIRAWLVNHLASRLGVTTGSINTQKPFAEFGIGSVQAVGLAGELQDWLGKPLSPTLAYEFPTIEVLAKHLAGEPATIDKPVEPIAPDEPIAIIGIGCRFPGAANPAAFWSLLRDGRDAVGDPPSDRPWVGPTSAPPRRGGYLEHVDRFDANFFGISPREAARIDPQHRLLLEVAWEALEDAGQVAERLAGTRVGVFIGIAHNEYARFALEGADDGHALTGNAASIAANRISYLFDLRGPSVAIDTACSSSLVAVHMACQSLRSTDSTLAIAGGVNLILAPAVTAAFERAGFLAPDGRCKAFDARADGYVRSEGCGLVVLKPLPRALADGDAIYAVIRGSAVNQDGRTNGLTSPSRAAQEEVMREAYRRAGVRPCAVQYVEAHGTGTLLGDPIEAQALGSVLAEGRPAGQRCGIGSVKTNIGHLEAAAGVAGLIKVALSLAGGQIPPSLHFEAANPHVPFDVLPLAVQTTLAPAPDLAGVSSFGFGGTNAHVVLERVAAPRHCVDRPTHPWQRERHWVETAAVPGGVAAPAARNGHAVKREPLRWGEASADQQRELLVNYFRGRLAVVLGHDADRIDPNRSLDALGLDSLTALELKTDAEADLGVSVPLGTLFEGPTIAQLVDQLLATAHDAPSASSMTPKRAEPSEFPLTPGQRALWAVQQLDPTSAIYNLAGAARARGELDRDILRAGLQMLVDRHASLRTTFALGDGQPVQRIEARAEVAFQYEDLEGWSEAAILDRLADNARRPFDLERGPLFRACLLRRARDDQYLVLAVHHAVSDFWSVAVLLDELGRIYAALRAGVEPELEPLELSFADVARARAERLGDPGEPHWSYWRDELTGPPPALVLPTDRPRPAVMTYRGAVTRTELDSGLTERLGALASAHGTSLYVTLLAAWQALLGRISGQDDFAIGSPVAGRNESGVAGVVGYFVNPLPIRARLAGDPTFAELLARVRRALVSGLEHQEVPFPLMVERLQPPRDPSRAPLFQVMFVWQRAQRLDERGLTAFALRGAGPRMAVAGVPLESVALDLGVAQFDLTLMAAESAGGVVASLEYNTDLYDRGTAERLLDRFRAVLAAVASRPSARISELPAMTDDERRQVVRDWNATSAAWPRDALVHRLFVEQAERAPTALAVVCAGDALTYAELDARSNRLARRLRAQGVGPETRVGLCAPRSTELIVGLLAILKAGGAYVPLDPDYPAERLELLRTDAGIELLVTREWIREHQSEGDSAPLEEIALPENGAYVIYTSGSTGRPKGVEVTHRNLVHSTYARSIYYREPVQAFLLLSSLAFDSSVAGVFWTLVEGGTLVLPDAGDIDDPVRLGELVRRHRVSHLLCVPSLYGLILEGAGEIGGLRAAIVAGEACPADLPERHRARLPRTALYNEYGPTEATVWSTVHRCRGREPDGRLPIGRPIPNVRVYLLDRLLEPAPIGVAGEIYIGGEGVARGYLGQPGLTAERFVPDHLGAVPGGRLYRTGDRARWRADGAIEFLGRLDSQVKVRGFRIELEEVESVLGRHPALRAAAVAVHQAPTGDVRLIGHVVPRDGQAPAAAELRRWLKASLPDYMIPSAFVVLASLPQSPNGKVDRRALTAIEVGDTAGDERPRDASEAALERIAAEVLGRPRVGIHADLFALGLDSIRGIQIASRARRAGLRVEPAQLFQHATVAELAAVASQACDIEETPFPSPAPAAGSEIEDEYPLSPVQAGMLFHSRLEPEGGIYVQQFTCLIRGSLDGDAFKSALERIVEQHSVLRTAVGGASDRPTQVVYRGAELPFEFRDMRTMDGDLQEQQLDEYLRGDCIRGFDPSRPPLVRIALFRLAAAEYQLVWSNHHLLMDGWCVPLLLGQVLAAYEAIARGDQPVLPRCRPYRDYIAWLDRQDLNAAESYWRETLRGFGEPTPLGVDRALAAAEPGASRYEREVRVTGELTAALDAMCRSNRLTLNTIVQGAWALLLGRYSGRDDVVFGAAVSGRPAALADVETMVGLFLNTLPVRVRLDGDAALLPWLAELQAAQVETRRFEFSPLVQVHGWSDVPRTRPLFESIVVFENYPRHVSVLEPVSGLTFGEPRVIERTNYPLTLFAAPGDELTLRAVADPRRFESDALVRLLGHLRTIIEAMAFAPDRRLDDVPLLTDAEQRQFENWTEGSSCERAPAFAAASAVGIEEEV
jgi:amino acid adenylation domain-containing protein